jgi:hypothetical protein
MTECRVRARGRVGFSLQTCARSRHIASDTVSHALSSRDLRIPHHFDEGEDQTNILGSVASQFHCTGGVRVIQPAVAEENPCRETASCRTRFGDRLTYVFNQASWSWLSGSDPTFNSSDGR